MLVLVTGGSSALAQTIAARIREQGHAVRLTDRAALPPAAPDIIHEDGANRMRTSVQQVQCALDADDATDALCDGVDQIVHVEPAVSAEDESWLDIATRCTYNLLRSAAAAGVSRATVLGSMDVFMRYDVQHGVMPDWQPRPSCSQPSALGPHMAEYVAREFALCSSVRILVARIGSLVHEAPAPGADARWWITGQEVAEELVAEMAADDSRADASSGVDLWSRNPFVRWNLARGGLDPLEAGLPWLAANGGTPTWHRPPAPILPEPRPAPPAGTKPVALLLGGSGMLGPSIVPVIDADFRVIITDVIDRPALRDEAQVMRWETANETTTAVAPAALDIDASKQGSHEWRSVDICNYDEVAAASSDTDVMMVLSVVRTHPKLSFDVNAQGVFNACKAAVANGHTRLINTGPWTVVAGHAKTFFHNVTEDMPAATGLDLYSFSKVGYLRALVSCTFLV